MDGPAKTDDLRLAVGTAEASQWKLMWIRFKQHRIAMVGLVIVGALYFIAAFAEFFQPFEPLTTSSAHTYHPPQRLHFIDYGADGGWAFRPHTVDMALTRDPLTLTATYAAIEGRKTYVVFLARSESYLLAGLIPMHHRLIGPAEPGRRFYLLGADRLGRDLLSRIIAGTRISMSIGLVGVGLSLLFGLIIGGLAGYLGGWIDSVSSRIIELIIGIPTIPIWLGLSAAIPFTWEPLTRYFAITVILSVVGWTELARVVRGRFLSLRTEDFVVAARLDGASTARIVFRHMMPSLTSHIIASVTLAIPVMILAETSLSFLGLGLQPPIVSWGVLLKESQNIRSIAEAPWLFVPGVFVAIAVLALNFLGDGLRDAADPYAHVRT